MKKPKGLILYQGPSRLPRGGPIVVIATIGKSTNRKTGDMIQVYILRSDMSPIEAVTRGLDRSICGDCPHRAPSGKGHKGRSCYVNIGTAPMAVYKAFKAGRYSKNVFPSVARGRSVRLGAYGDPAAAPFEVFRDLTFYATHIVGYTQRWRDCDQRFQSYTMASVTSEAERAVANCMGWRTFRVKRPADLITYHEMECPSAKIQCAECGLCGGNRKRYSPSITINVHGSGKGNFQS